MSDVVTKLMMVRHLIGRDVKSIPRLTVKLGLLTSVLGLVTWHGQWTDAKPTLVGLGMLLVGGTAAYLASRITELRVMREELEWGRAEDQRNRFVR